jgi:hypothetical protein
VDTGERGASRKVFKRFLALLEDRVGKSGRVGLAPVVGLELPSATLCQVIEDLGFFWGVGWRLSRPIRIARRMMLLSGCDGLRRDGNKPPRQQRPQRAGEKAGGGSTLSGCQAAWLDHAGGIRCLLHLSFPLQYKDARSEGRSDRSFWQDSSGSISC